MITDNKTNFVYFAEGLRFYKTACASIIETLESLGIQHEFIPELSSKKHIWVRDYMPIQTMENRYIKFKYTPDYLEGTNGYSPDVANILERVTKGNMIESDIVIDGGNMVKCDDKIIMTDKIFWENPSIKPVELLDKIENLLNCEIVLVPWDMAENYGHTDGMVRYIGNSTVLLNNYQNLDPRFGKVMNRVLKEHFEVKSLFYEGKLTKRYCWGYINFLQVGDNILVPQFGIQEDSQAIKQIQTLYPNCKVIPINGCEEIARSGGVLNCVSWNIKKD